MKVAIGHEWNVSVSEARALQRELAPKVDLRDAVDPQAIRTVAGVDNGYVKQDGGFVAFAAVIVMTFPDLETIDTVIAHQPVTFPYVPGLLTFREAPAILTAFERVTVEPDVILFDGQGIAHPLRFGLASHLGVVLDWPSIGCAKSRLTGYFKEPGDQCGATSPIKIGDEVIGTALRSLPGHKPLIISPGHKVSISSAADLALACCDGTTFMPRPTQAAHNAVAEATAPLRKKR